MHYLKQLSLLAVAAFALCAARLLQADERTDTIDAQDFVEEASAKGVAEIEVAKLALEKATSDEVKGFAQTMMDDHSRSNQQLRELATRKQLELSDEAGLIDKAKALVLQLRGEESFDKAYMNNQVLAHQQAITLFRRASDSSDEDVAALARETLPKLEQHLQKAEQINAKLPDD